MRSVVSILLLFIFQTSGEERVDNSPIMVDTCTTCASQTGSSTDSTSHQQGKTTPSPPVAMTNSTIHVDNSIVSVSSNFSPTNLNTLLTTTSSHTFENTSDCQETMIYMYSLLGIMLLVSCSLNVAMVFITIVVVKKNSKRKGQHTCTSAKSEQQDYSSIQRNSYRDTRSAETEDGNPEPKYAVVNKPKRPKDSRQTPPQKPHPLDENDNQTTREEKKQMTKKSSYEVVTLDHGAESINVERQYDTPVI